MVKVPVDGAVTSSTALCVTLYSARPFIIRVCVLLLEVRPLRRRRPAGIADRQGADGVHLGLGTVAADGDFDNVLRCAADLDARL